MTSPDSLLQRVSDLLHSEYSLFQRVSDLLPTGNTFCYKKLSDFLYSWLQRVSDALHRNTAC